MTDRAAGYDPGGPYPGLPRAVGETGKARLMTKKAVAEIVWMLGKQ
ncbi:MAG: hypothetical protein ACLR0U_31360 [Enterocloster clostridioformis]